MKQLVKEGQANISTPSKITKGVGDVAQFILSAKGMIDMAIHNILQAALPWAGVCVGLQASSQPSHLPNTTLTDKSLDPLKPYKGHKTQLGRRHTCRL